ncbi:MAG: N-glycosylase/DNA lyase [Candidatus Nezhaarchaeota archaeon]|nr:N-glycosylase/DNA lyase [Candidatus Nezhaarchaeota archaeon]MCX8141236.1 N-glycosylase/DNA lyase [Candidatus Nezhaarchaeota archaeon]MDW8049502.1 N-glycosylase/DNA lyase [Nitrososphaerota archaeon]
MSALKLNADRASEIGSLLTRIGLDGALKIEEFDPQFQAIKLLTGKMNLGPALTLVVLNSLVSYKLSGRGEDYWSEFAIYMSRMGEPKSLKEAIKFMVGFLSSSKTNMVKRGEKIARLLKLLANESLEPWNIARHARSPRNMAKIIASNLRTSWTSKTIVFAVKMFYYAYRAYTGKELVMPFNVPIPIDSRVAKISWTSGILDVMDINSLSWGNIVRVIMSKPRVAQRAWNMVAKASRIPPLHLDSIVWIVGGFVGRSYTRDEAIKLASNTLSRMALKSGNEVFEVVSRLITRYLP